MMTSAWLALFAGKTIAQESTPISFDQTMAAVLDLRTNKDLKNNVYDMNSEVSFVIQGILDNSDRAGELKQVLFSKLPAKTFTMWQSSVISPASEVLGLLYKTRMCVPINLDDTKLKSLANPREDKEGRPCVRKIAIALWNSRHITTNEWQVFEQFQPEVSAQLLSAICDPSFAPIRGVNTPTASSESYCSVVSDALRAETFDRSREAKLLIQDGGQWMSMQSTEVVFTETGWPSIQISTRFRGWIWADIPMLEGMLSNPYWANDARYILRTALSVPGY